MASTGPGARTRPNNLLEMVQAGDERAFEQLYGLFAERLRGMVAALLGDDHEAEEVVQETFITLLVRPPVNGTGSIDAWLYTVARNAALTRRARNERSESCTPARVARELERSTIEDDEEPSMGEEAFWSLVARLPPIQRRVLALRFVDDLSTEQIASSALGRSPEAVRQLQSRALRLLRDRFSVAGARR